MPHKPSLSTRCFQFLSLDTIPKTTRRAEPRAQALQTAQAVHAAAPATDTPISPAVAKPKKERARKVSSVSFFIYDALELTVGNQIGVNYLFTEYLRFCHSRPRVEHVKQITFLRSLLDFFNKEPGDVTVEKVTGRGIKKLLNLAFKASYLEQNPHLSANGGGTTPEADSAQERARLNQEIRDLTQMIEEYQVRQQTTPTEPPDIIEEILKIYQERIEEKRRAMQKLPVPG